MILQLQPKDVSAFWEGIKICLVRANEVSDEHYEEYTLNALEKLMSGKLQCWVVFNYDEEGRKNIRTMFITSIMEDRVFGYRSLYIEALYGFRKFTDVEALETIEQLKKYCKNTKCRYVRAITSNERVKEIAQMLGFQVLAASYSLEV